MTRSAIGEGPRYWAFISYSHKDVAHGHKLHRKLEGFVLPRRQVGLVTRQGTLPRRLAPIFRDRDDLSASQDLSAEVRAALADSRALVVVCSPAAVTSKWVGREVEVFRALHPERPILAAVVEGDPKDAIPASLRGGTGEDFLEPLAADFRVEGDGERVALLKLVAGIADIRLDQLAQRDSQRRLQRVMTVTAGAVLGMIVMGVLAGYALDARTDADRQRTQAEGLVEFMLTDLRTTLKGVGRLDAMAAVNRRALQYYENNDVDALAPEALERRVRILHAMGEDDEARGDWNAAKAKFVEARRTSKALLDKAPNDPDLVFEHAQSEFWIGQIAYQQKHYQDAKRGFEAYKRLVDRLLVLDPVNPRSLREMGYAEGNLCMVAYTNRAGDRDAVPLCQNALTHMEAAAQRMHNSPDILADVANRHAWLADAYYTAGRKSECIAHRRMQESILAELMRADPKNMDIKDSWIALQRILAWLEANAGEKPAALARLRRARTISSELVAFDPSNQSWLHQKIAVSSDIARLLQEHRQNPKRKGTHEQRATLARF